MTTYTVEALLQAIDEVTGGSTRRARILNRALELAAAQLGADGPCQFCGGVGCVRCSARKQPSASEPVAWLKFDKGTNLPVDGEKVSLLEPTAWNKEHAAIRGCEYRPVCTAPQPSPQQAGESFAATQAQDQLPHADRVINGIAALVSKWRAIKPAEGSSYFGGGGFEGCHDCAEELHAFACRNIRGYSKL